MKKSRLGNNPLDGANASSPSDPLAWISDSRLDEEADSTTPAPSDDGGPHKQAVILSGGGALGAFEIGVLKALIGGRCPATSGTPFSIDIATGTSVGAFNAACLSLYEDPSAAIENLERIWVDKISENSEQGGNGVFRFRPPAMAWKYPNFILRNPLEMLSRIGQDSAHLTQDWLNRGIGLLKSDEPLEHRALEMIDLSSFVSTEPLRHLIGETVPLDRLRQSAIDLRIVTTDWESGDAAVFSRSELLDEMGHDVILASTALPGFFPPVTIGGRTYCDGGVVMNTPTMPAIDAGADELHVIYMDPDVDAIPLARFRNTLDTFDRMLTIQFAMNINHDLRQLERINHGIRAIDSDLENGSDSTHHVRSFVKAAGHIRKRLQSGERPFRKLLVHRYHPTEDLSGVLGLLNFGRDRIKALIERGEKEAEQHDCARSGCILVD